MLDEVDTLLWGQPADDCNDGLVVPVRHVDPLAQLLARPVTGTNTNNSQHTSILHGLQCLKSCRVALASVDM